MGRSHVVSWADHAVVKSAMLGITRSDVEDAVLDHYDDRMRNTGAADWLVVVRGLAVAFNHPDPGDATTARVVTLWRRA